MNSSRNGNRHSRWRSQWAVFWAFQVILIAGVVKVVGATLVALNSVPTA
jgi:hypothetical protein